MNPSVAVVEVEAESVEHDEERDADEEADVEEISE